MPSPTLTLLLSMEEPERRVLCLFRPPLCMRLTAASRSATAAAEQRRIDDLDSTQRDFGSPSHRHPLLLALHHREMSGPFIALANHRQLDWRMSSALNRGKGRS